MPTMMMIPRKTLLKAPVGAVKVFLGASKISNELNISTKYYWFAKNSVFSNTSKNPTEAIAARSVLYHRLVMLSGHAHECNRFLRTTPVKKLIAEKETDDIKGFKEKLGFIHAYFSNVNLISILRDKISFHTDTGILYSMVENAPTDYAFSVLNGETLGHIVFSGSDLLIERILDETPASLAIPYQEGFESAPDQIHQIADYMGIVLQSILGYIAHHYLELHFGDAFELPEPEWSPPIDSVLLPFFCKR